MDDTYDATDAGGGTHFTKLNITILPKCGRVVIWPNVIDDDITDQRDDRTYHQALPVLRGVKYGANAWIHQRDYKTSDELGCI